jgi:hypoxanthine phosphoribosyltransferase
VKTLLTETQIRTAIESLADRLNHDYHRRPLTLIAVMTGSIVFLADLIRLLHMPLRVGVVQASSYKSGTTRGALSINADMMPDIRGRDVLLIDDIFDTGHTLAEVVRRMRELGPLSLRTAVLLEKQGRQEVSLRPDYVAFEIPDEFVVGYGLDYGDEYRNLAYIATLEPHEIAAHARQSGA